MARSDNPVRVRACRSAEATPTSKNTGITPMANATVNFTGQANQAGATDALFLKIMGGEVVTAFETACVFKDRVMQRQISSGKSAQFPRMGHIAAAYHTPGNEIVGETTNFNEVVVTIDDLLIAHSFIANLDEAKAHYDVRGPISQEIGRALAYQWDSHLAQLGVLAARSANVVTGLPGGSQIKTSTAGAPASADYMNNGSHLATALFLAAKKLDENDIPSDDRVAVVRPAQYYALSQVTNNINTQWGGAGAYRDGSILRIAGFDVVKSNHLPSTDLSADTSVKAGTGNKYRGDFSETAALCMHKSVLGTVKLMDLSTEMAYDIRRQGTLFVAKYAVGHGILRPEGAVEVSQTA